MLGGVQGWSLATFLQICGSKNLTCLQPSISLSVIVITVLILDQIVVSQKHL